MLPALVLAIFSGLMFLFGPVLFEGFGLKLFTMKLGSWFLLVAGCLGVVFGSVLPMFLFGPFLFVVFVFGTLCHEVGFLVSLGCRLFWGCFCSCFACGFVWSFSFC